MRTENVSGRSELRQSDIASSPWYAADFVVAPRQILLHKLNLDLLAGGTVAAAHAAPVDATIRPGDSITSNGLNRKANRNYGIEILQMKKYMPKLWEARTSTKENALR